MTSYLQRMIHRRRDRKRAARRMKRFSRWHRSKKLAKEIKADVKGLQLLRKEEKKEDHNVGEAMAFLDADEGFEAMKERIEDFQKIHEEIAHMEFLIGVEEHKEMSRLAKLEKEMIAFNQKHSNKYLGDAIRRTQEHVNNIRNIVAMEKKREKDLIRDREKFRDKSYLPFMMLFLELRKNSRDAKRRTKHVKKANRHAEKLLHKLEHEKDMNKLEKEFKAFNNYLERDENEIEQEIKDLGKIQSILTVISFRESSENVLEELKKLQELKFPEEKQRKLLEQLQHAQDELDEMHKKQLAQTAALGQESKNITA